MGFPEEKSWVGALAWPQTAPSKAVSPPLGSVSALCSLPGPDPVITGLPPLLSPPHLYQLSIAFLSAEEKKVPGSTPMLPYRPSPALHQPWSTQSQTHSGTGPWKTPNPRFLLPVRRCSLANSVEKRYIAQLCCRLVGATQPTLPALPLEWAP